MDSLVPAVLFRMTRGNPLRYDPQFHPVDRQHRQSSNRSGGKGRSVVGADRQWQAMLPECCLADGTPLLGVGLFFRLAAEKKPTGVVADGPRFETLAISG